MLCLPVSWYESIYASVIDTSGWFSRSRSGFAHTRMQHHQKWFHEFGAELGGAGDGRCRRPRDGRHARGCFRTK
jgi:hypothetical protein